MVKTTREGENLRRSPRLTSVASSRLREEDQAILSSQTCSLGPMKGDASETVDPMGQPNSKFMVPSQQPALTLVASTATEDPSRQLSSSAIDIENQVACMKSTSIDRGLASSSSTAFKYIQHFSAPAQESAHFSDTLAKLPGIEPDHHISPNPPPSPPEQLKS